VTPRRGDAPDGVVLSRAAAGTTRAVREGPALVRSEISDTPEDDSMEIPLPVALGQDADSVRVLHVDDNPEITDVTAISLQRVNEDFVVETETTVVAALDRLANEEIDCVVSDYDMPNTDGLEFLDIVRERYPDLPFILFTGKGSEEIASEAIAADVTDYMQKGVRSDQYEVLANRIENAVDRYRTQQQFWNALSWYRRLVEQELAGVLIVQDGTFAYVNEQLADILGSRQADLIDASPTAVAASGSDEAVLRREFVETDRRDGDTLRFSVCAERADGSTVSVEVHGGKVEYEGQPALLGICRPTESTDR
jgi:PAS domain S-box-containing protein